MFQWASHHQMHNYLILPNQDVWLIIKVKRGVLYVICRVLPSILSPITSQTSPPESSVKEWARPQEVIHKIYQGDRQP